MVKHPQRLADTHTGAVHQIWQLQLLERRKGLFMQSLLVILTEVRLI